MSTWANKGWARRFISKDSKEDATSIRFFSISLSTRIWEYSYSRELENVPIIVAGSRAKLTVILNFQVKVQYRDKGCVETARTVLNTLNCSYNSLCLDMHLQRMHCVAVFGYVNHGPWQEEQVLKNDWFDNCISLLPPGCSYRLLGAQILPWKSSVTV